MIIREAPEFADALRTHTVGATSHRILRFSGRDEENPSEDIFWKARLGASASHAHLTSARARHRHAIHMSAFAVSASSVRAVSTAIGYVRDRLRPIHHSPIVSNTIGITRPKYPIRSDADGRVPPLSLARFASLLASSDSRLPPALLCAASPRASASAPSSSRPSLRRALLPARSASPPSPAAPPPPGGPTRRTTPSSNDASSKRRS